MIKGFIPSQNHEDITSTCIYFIFKLNKILINIKKKAVPCNNELNKNDFDYLYLGKLNSVPVLASFNAKNDYQKGDLKYIDILKAYTILGNQFFSMAAYAYHMSFDHYATSFCGICGKKIPKQNTGTKKKCTNCNTHIFPRISPAIIVAVRKGEELLLGRGKNFPKGFYSVLAGYVDVGENLEECVKREVKEEAGIEITNIQYFASQPWGISSSLMIGFTAEYKSGTIEIDENEMLDVQWFKYDELPQIPPVETISGQLIDSVINFCKAKKYK